MLLLLSNYYDILNYYTTTQQLNRREEKLRQAFVKQQEKYKEESRHDTFRRLRQKYGRCVIYTFVLFWTDCGKGKKKYKKNEQQPTVIQLLKN